MFGRCFSANRLFLVVLFGAGSAPVAYGQTVQLPTVNTFSVQTTVMVPDGGTMLLGSIGQSAMGETLRGVPLLGNIPGAGRLFKNRGIGQETSSKTATVSTDLIIMSELEPQVLAEGQRRLAESRFAPNPATQKKAEFMSRNIGQSPRRR